VNTSTICRDTIDVLKERGRSFGDYEYGGKLCVLAGMAVSANRPVDHWGELQIAMPFELDDVDLILLEAARLLVRAISPDVAVRELSVDDLIERISGWHDGPKREDGTYPDAPANSAVFAALTQAAHLAAQTGVAA
jgi:hypothetical protein